MEISFATPTRTVVTHNETGMISTTFIPLPSPIQAGLNKEKQNMYECDFEDDENCSARCHLRERLDDITDAHVTKIGHHFHTIDDEAPDSAAAVVARLRDGKFVFLNEKEKDEPGTVSRYTSLGHLVRWRDPNAKEDKVGAAAARAKMEAARDRVKDSIYVDAPSDAKRALYEFESATFH